MRILVLLIVALVVWYGLRGSLGPSAVLVLGALGAAVLVGRKQSRGVVQLVATSRSSRPRGAAVRAGSSSSRTCSSFGSCSAPARLVQPHWLQFSSELESPALRALLGTMISLTPGTMTVELDDDGTIWVHVLVAEDDNEVIRRIRDVLERPLRRLES